MLREFIVLRSPGSMPENPIKHPRFNSGPSTEQRKKGGKINGKRPSPSRVSSHSNYFFMKLFSFSLQ